MTGAELAAVGLLLFLIGVAGAGVAKALSLPRDVDHEYARKVMRHVRRHGEYHDTLVHVLCDEDGVWRLPVCGGLEVLLDGWFEVEQFVATLHRRARLAAEAEALAAEQDGAA
jgi:hypothetical protein